MRGRESSLPNCGTEGWRDPSCNYRQFLGQVMRGGRDTKRMREYVREGGSLLLKAPFEWETLHVYQFSCIYTHTHTHIYIYIL